LNNCGRDGFDLSLKVTEANRVTLYDSSASFDELALNSVHS